MSKTQGKMTIPRIVYERIVTPIFKRRKPKDYKDDSIELRRYLAAEVANRQFEQCKERALSENHRAGFMR